MESESEKQIKLIHFLIAFQLANYFCKNANNIDIIIKFDTYKMNILYMRKLCVKKEIILSLY